MVLALLACTAVPPVDGEPPTGPNLWRSWPYSPQLGSMVDPRLAGCRVSWAAEDDSSVHTWAYDARGRATSEDHRWEGDGIAYEDEWRWGAEDCMRSADTTRTSAESTYESHTDFACDARGNPESTTWVTDGETTEGVTFWNEYDDLGQLVARELTRDGWSPYEQETFTYDGGWLASYATRSLWDEAEEVVASWSAGPDGLIERYSEEICALDGAEECGERLAVTYTFDGDGVLVSADWVSRSLWLTGGGRVENDGETTYFFVYTADERGLPASVGDEGGTVLGRYTTTCGPPPPSLGGTDPRPMPTRARIADAAYRE